MNIRPNIVPQIETPISALPDWDQMPPDCQKDLIQALAALLLRLPQLQAIEQKMSVSVVVEPGASHEQRE